MKLLVFGHSGQVARELARHCPPDVRMTFVPRTECDLARPMSCALRIRESRYDAVINAAAFTAVDAAETHESQALVINGEAPGAMARACADKGVPFLHLSTDYVFDGAGDAPFTLRHEPSPLNAYGRTKLAGERAVQASGAKYLVLRTSWVVSAHGHNFVRTMLRLGASQPSVRVVSDQSGAPTAAGALAGALVTAARALVEGHAGGVYHYAGSPDTTWEAFARQIMRVAELPCRVEGISSDEYATPARRPANSRLDCTDFERDFAVPRPDWRGALPAMVREIEKQLWPIPTAPTSSRNS